MKSGFKTTEFLMLPVVLPAMVANPEVAWPLATAYAAYAVSRAAVKYMGGSWESA